MTVSKLGDLQFNGSDGIAAADHICLYEVNRYEFGGKGDRVFNQGEVKAFICDTSRCNNLLGNTTYWIDRLYAYPTPLSNMANFRTSNDGSGPGDNNQWKQSPDFSWLVG